MSIPGSSNALFLAAAAGGGGYQVERSLRFNSSDSAYLSRTPASAGNRRTWTFSAWVKRSLLGSSFQTIIGAGTGGNAEASIRFNSDDTLEFYDWTGGYNARLLTTQVFRDVSAWYHLVAVFDTPNATADQRIRLYVNGIEITTFSSRTNPTQNYDGYFNNSISHTIGDAVSGASPRFFNGYLADVHFIDGQALTPSSFTEVSATTGQLIPKAYTGSYGTNGFRLSFSDNSGTTSTTLGKDAAGSNNWTPNNFSVASGSGNDSLVDTPTSYGTDTGAGGEVRGNYAVFNALALNGNTLSNGNLDYLAGSANKPTLTTVGIPNTGKWYFEFTDVNSTGSFTAGVGTASVGVSSYLGADANGWGYQTHPTNAGYHNSGVFTTTGRINGAGSNTIVGVAIDRDAQKIWFSVNGTYVNSGVPASGTNAQYSNLPSSGELFPGASTGSGQNIVFNAGQRPFAYTAPSGFKALCDTNLPAPVVALPSTVFDVALDTGANILSAAQNKLSTGTDLLWIKDRANANNHQLIDTVRGGTATLQSNTTAAETTYSAPAGSSVAWCWDAGSDLNPTTNTQGSITSSCRTNQSSGFSVATWTGSGSGSITVGHGLGVAPQFFIVKDRSNARNWLVYHVGMGATRGMQLNLTTGQSGADAGYWNNTAPTSTVATIGTYGNEAANYVGYFWAPVVGYSSFGSYTGNGSTDGPFVYTGFRPRWVMIKPLYQYDGGGSTVNSTAWYIYDSARGTYNANGAILGANNSYAEENNATDIDFLSNGFKLRNTRAVNTSNGAIYAAFAESPFQYARAR